MKEDRMELTGRKYELLLFDADDTLFDFNKAMREALTKALADQAVRCTDEMIARYDAINQQYWRRYEAGEVTKKQMQTGRFAEFLASCGIDCAPEPFDARYLDYLGGCPYLYDGAKELCADLSRFYRLAIVTNGISAMQRRRMENSEIARFFEQIFISGDTGYKKPEKGFFDYVFSRYPDVSHEKMLIIGDSLGSDIKGGIGAGIATCWINTRREPPDNALTPDYSCKDISGLRSLLLS
jgi:HAD superfamily (subfamily IA) hydrolase, TIGR02254